jgi:enoyl-CoA hydratase/carnithine racemase
VSYETIRYEIKGPLALITMDRAAKLNAISLAMLDELHAALSAATRDDRARAIALTGSGRAFASGSDLTEVQHRDLNKAMEPLVQGISEHLQRCPKPTIAAINGICYGGGLELALGCDLRVASTRARFATPEGKLGIIPGGGASQRLPRIVGRSWAMEMLVMGTELDAERAYQVGLVSRLVEPSELLPEVHRMADRIASFAPLVPLFMKAMVNYGMEGSLVAGLALEKFAQGALLETEDKKEGLEAFLGKRKPRWKGR